ncbi:MAG: diguanylate cyclase [Leptolyngbyaceae cyanobacterium MO_188.B28]|nr:diguanylate cyclase [Leptolyngbyaceae cyanobacterium MO_188.B28]
MISSSSGQPAAILADDEYRLGRRQAALIELSACQAIYDGDLHAAFQQITQLSGQALNVDRVSIWLYDKLHNELTQANLYELNGDRHSSGKRVRLVNHPKYCKIFEAQSLVVSHDVQQDSKTWELAATWPPPWETAAKVDAPIRSGCHAAGRVWFEQVQTPHHWTIDEQNFVIHTANLISLALEAHKHQQTAGTLKQKQSTLAQQTLQLWKKIIGHQQAEQAVQERQKFIHSIKETLRQQNLQLRRKIIEAQQMEQAWQESQRFIHSIADASTSILYVHDLNADLIIYANQQLSAVLGYTLEDIQGLGGSFVKKLAHADDLGTDQTGSCNLLNNQDGNVQDEEVLECERRVRHKSGEWRWLMIREAVFRSDELGQPIQIIGNAADISDRKQAEASLQALNSELEKLAATDGLTQLANRRSFDQALHREWSRMRQAQKPLSLILGDIDCFKPYNDTYGHQAGDDCIQQVAAAIRQAAIGSTDLVARYGGEEFAVIVSDTDVEEAVQVAKQILSAVKALQISHGQSTVGSVVTMSLGVATVIPNGKISPDSLIALADKGLYQAKREGRDRYCIQP